VAAGRAVRGAAEVVVAGRRVAHGQRGEEGAAGAHLALVRLTYVSVDAIAARLLLQGRADFIVALRQVRLCSSRRAAKNGTRQFFDNFGSPCCAAFRYAFSAWVLVQAPLEATAGVCRCALPFRWRTYCSLSNEKLICEILRQGRL
jgi:hypothetical protein